MNSSSKTPFQQVQDFQREVLRLEPAPQPTMLSIHAKHTNTVYLHEELNELFTAFNADDIVGAADALADLIYFAYGIAAKMGLPFDQIWQLVHAANMKKVYGVTKRGFPGDAVKPTGWEDPKIAIEQLLKSISPGR